MSARGIVIRTGSVEAVAELNTSASSSRILESLPIVGHANVWGDEIYFQIPVDLDLEDDAREEVEVGDLGYWPTGSAFCVFFGRTPVSTGDKPRAYSPVNVLGSIVGDATVFKAVSDGDEVTIEREK